MCEMVNDINKFAQAPQICLKLNYSKNTHFHYIDPLDTIKVPSWRGLISPQKFIKVPYFRIKFNNLNRLRMTQLPWKYHKTLILMWYDFTSTIQQSPPKIRKTVHIPSFLCLQNIIQTRLEATSSSSAFKRLLCVLSDNLENNTLFIVINLDIYKCTE